MPFTNDNPESGAEQLRKWAWDVIEYREGIELPEKLDHESLEFLLSHLDFLGERFLFALHFALCAIAKEELNESRITKSSNLIS